MQLLKAAGCQSERLDCLPKESCILVKLGYSVSQS
jgi:hypothetical protein